VLLLSPDAARSEWVNQEIAYWVEHRDPKKILPVVTDGSFGWTGDVAGDAVPNALHGVFTEEPRWVDVRWARDQDQLDLQDPRFADAVADIASTIRGIPKDDLASEEVRQHRRTVRTAWAAGGLVTALAVAAVGFGVSSSRNADEAERQAEIAAEQADIAEANAEEAESQAEFARTQAAIAKARELAASSVNASKEDPQLGLLLAVQAVDSLPAGETVGPAIEAALRDAMSEDRLLARYERLAAPSPSSLDVSPDGAFAAISVLESRTLEVLDTETLAPLWRFTEDTADGFDWVAFSSDSSKVALSIADERYFRHEVTDAGAQPAGEPDARFVVFDAETGDVLHTEVFNGACAVNVRPGSWRDDLGLLGVGFVGCGADGEFQGTIRFFDTDSWATVFEREARDLPHVAFGGSGTLAALMSGVNSEPATAIVDTETFEVVREGIEAPFGALSPDGEVFVADVGIGARIEMARSGELIDRLSTGSFFIGTVRFSDQGDLLLDLIGDETLVVDPTTGAEITRLQAGRADGGAMLNGGKLYTASEGVISVWDQAGVTQGDMNTVPLGLWVNSNSIFHAGGTVVAHVYDFDSDNWFFYPVDAEGLLGDPVEVTDVWEMTPIQGNRMLIQRVEENESGLVRGPIEVLDLASGASEVVAGCWMPEASAVLHESCPDGEPHPSGIIAVVGSRSGDEVLIFDELQQGELRDIWVSIWETETMSEVQRLNLGRLDAWGNQMRDSAITDDYLVLFNRRTGSIDVRDRHTLEPLPLEGPTVTASRLEHDTVQNAMWLTDDGDRVLRLDLDRMIIEPVSEEGTPGFARGLASSPSGDRVAVGSTDGAVRIFSIDGELLHLIPLPNPSDAYWLDDLHLVVGTANGPWTTITLDPNELADVARERLRRSFTSTECEFFDVDPCPTLEELQGG
jgi:WD40 repeat protein